MNDYLEKWCCLIIFLDKRDEQLSAENQEQQPEIFLQRYKNILQISAAINCTKHYYTKYAAHIELHDRDKVIPLEENEASKQRLDAFANAFNMGFRKVIVVDAEIQGLETNHLKEAFNSLKIIEFCIGPGKFGGLYLFGMNYFEPAILQNVQWNSPNITKEIIKEIGKLKQALYKLPVLPSTINK